MKSRTFSLDALTITCLLAIKANADQWGCEVLLCLSNPAGPTAVEQCKPPIQRLWDHLRDGHAFPSCEMAQGAGGASFAKQAYSHYDPCPIGTRAARRDEKVMQGASAQHITMMRAPRTVGPFLVGIGEGDGYVHRDLLGNLPQKVCVGNRLGAVVVNNSDARTTYPVNVYESLVVLKPYPSPRVIDVYVNNAFYRRVRW